MSNTALIGSSRYLLKDNDLVMGEGDTKYILKVRDLPEEERPREKMLLQGPQSLSVAELVAILMGVGTKKEEVMQMAQRILKEYGESAIVNERSAQKLADSLAIPLPKACQIVASFELGRRFFQKRSGRAVFISTANQAFDHLRDMSAMKKEQLRGLYLNSRYQVIHEEVISVGSLTANIVHPREVFQPAIEHGAVAILIAHNHPSGSLAPTLADHEVTERLLTAGKLLGIDILDHLIIADDQYMSIMPSQNYENL